MGRKRGASGTSELAAPARIREAALVRFAAVGFAGTSIRDVARAARVSPGLIQHHFRSKARLRQAVDAFVARRTTEAFADLVGGDGAADSAGRLGARISAFIRANPAVFAYVGRSILEGDPPGVALLEHLLALARAQLERLAADDLLRPGLDVQWAALHVVLIDVGAFLLAQPLGRYLGAELTSPEGLARMERATAALFLEGIYRPRRERRRKSGRDRPADPRR